MFEALKSGLAALHSGAHLIAETASLELPFPSAKEMGKISDHGLKLATRTLTEFGQAACEEQSGELDGEIARLMELVSGKEGGCTWKSNVVDSDDWDAV